MIIIHWKLEKKKNDDHYNLVDLYTPNSDSTKFIHNQPSSGVSINFYCISLHLYVAQHHAAQINIHIERILLKENAQGSGYPIV